LTMTLPSVIPFLRSGAGRGFLIFSFCCALLSVAIGVGSYYLSLHWFQVNKGEEKITAARLVDAFVGAYTTARTQFMRAEAPVPATFRAQAVELFNKARNETNALHLIWAGVPGREIATAPLDKLMAQTIEGFVGEAHPAPVTRFVTVGDQQFFRTIYPSIASQRSCVDCHNQLQPDKPLWRINDIMGASVLDVPASAFLRQNLWNSVLIGFVVFFFATSISAVTSYLQYQESARRLASEASLQVAHQEIQVLNRDLERRVEERTSELHAAQQDLLRRERLSALGQVTATVAHELRNPLSSIRNTVYSIHEAVASKGLSLERPLARMERGIARCDRIVTDLLDYTRMRELKCTPTIADQWLGDTLDEQQLPEGVQLRRDFAAPDVNVPIDPERLRRAIVNLIENAAQAMAEPEQEGREKQIVVGTRAVGGRFEITIEDTGPGIAPDILPKVFEPLFSTKSFGTGLGLPTVKQIIESHGGTIDIASEVGRGTRVLVRLPLGVAEEVAA